MSAALEMQAESIPGSIVLADRPDWIVHRVPTGRSEASILALDRPACLAARGCLTALRQTNHLNRAIGLANRQVAALRRHGHAHRLGR